MTPHRNAKTPVGAGASLETKVENQTAPKITVISLRSSARVENFLSPSRLYSNKPRLSVNGCPTATKALIANAGSVWLFRVTEGDHVNYSVERGDRTWPFALLDSATSKFIEELNKSRRGDSR
jgi:hypothetical protein